MSLSISCKKTHNSWAVNMCTHIYRLFVCAIRHLSRLSLCLWLQYQSVKSTAEKIRIKSQLFFPRLFSLSLYLRISFPLKKTCIWKCNLLVNCVMNYLPMNCPKHYRRDILLILCRKYGNGNSPFFLKTWSFVCFAVRHTYKPLLTR